MKTILAVVLLAASLSACTGKTQYGDCIGALQDKKPNLTYELSVWNIFMAFVFSETVIVPVVVAANQHSCPIGVE